MAALGCLLLSVACSTTPSGEGQGLGRRLLSGEEAGGAELPGSARTTGAPVVINTEPLAGTSASVYPALRALEGAVDDGDEALARRILATLRARPLGERERDLVQAFERVLTGRELCAQLEFELRCILPELSGADEGGSEESAALPVEARVVLEIRNTGPASLVLFLPPADLEHLRLGVNARGMESREFSNELLDVFQGVRIEPDARREIPLGRFALARGRALAVRDRWQLSLRAGEILSDGRAYPASRLPSRRCETVTLHPAVAAEGESSPAELVRLLTDPEVSSGHCLVAGLRLPTEARDAALSELSPRVQSMALEDPERLRRVAPLLRWLSRAQEPGTDPGGWAAWFRGWEARRAERARAAEFPRGGLELP